MLIYSKIAVVNMNEEIILLEFLDKPNRGDFCFEYNFYFSHAFLFV